MRLISITLKLLFLYVLTISSIYAEPFPLSSGDGEFEMNIEHCTDNCGSVIVGAAKVQPKTIQWLGKTITPTSEQRYENIDTIQFSSENPKIFSITGEKTYTTSGYKPPNKWQYHGPAFVYLNNALGYGGAPEIGFFFAPDTAKNYQNIPIHYVITSHTLGIAYRLEARPLTTLLEELTTLLENENLSPSVIGELKLSITSELRLIKDRRYFGKEKFMDVVRVAANKFIPTTYNSLILELILKYVSINNNERIDTIKTTVTENVTGIGIADNEGEQAIITLDVQPDPNLNCDGNIKCVSVPLKDTLNFVITPRIKTLPTNLIEEDNEHVMIHLLVTDKVPGCETRQSFTEKGEKPDFSPDNYYDYLAITEPDVSGINCSRNYLFLAKKDRPFYFKATNQRNTTTNEINYDTREITYNANNGYVDYRFYVRGHYDKTNPEKWANISHHTFRLRTEQANLKVEVYGDGTVTSNPKGISCSKDNIGTCKLDFPKNTTVNLSASISDNVKWVGESCTREDNGNVKLSNDTCIVHFNSTGKPLTIDNLPIEEDPPVNTAKLKAVITASPLTTGKAPLTVSFDASQSTGDIAKYYWERDNSILSRNATPPEQRFTAQNRSYIIELTITDKNGVTSYDSVTITTSESKDTEIPSETLKPSAEFTFEEAEYVAGKYNVKVTATISGYENYNWLSDSGNINGVGQELTMVFDAAGSHDIKLIIEDELGQTDTVTHEVTIKAVVVDEPLSAHFEFEYGVIDNNINGVSKQLVKLDSSTSKGEITKYKWNVIDSCGKNSDQKETLKTSEKFLLKNGDYVIGLTITNSNGGTHYTKKPITIPNLSANFDIDFIGLRTIKLDASQSIIPNTKLTDCETQIDVNKNVEYWWWINDNSERIYRDDSTNPIIESYNFETEPSEIYDDYVITLVVHDENDKMAIETKSIKVLDDALLTLKDKDGNSDKGKILKTNKSASAGFKGGIFSNNLLIDGKFNYSKNVTIVATIDVNKDHYGDVEPLVVVRAVGNRINVDNQSWYIKDKNTNKFEPWYSKETCKCIDDGTDICKKQVNNPFCNWLPLDSNNVLDINSIENTEITPAASEPKEMSESNKTLKIDIFSNKITNEIFNETAHPANLHFSEIDIYIGYRVVNSIENTIVYSETPITIRNDP